MPAPKRRWSSEPAGTGTPPEGLAALPASGRRAATWPLWYLALTLAWAAAYWRSYPDESARRALAQVALLLAVVFTVALVGSEVLTLLPPAASSLLGAVLLLSLLAFCAWKLGDRLGTIAELIAAFVRRQPGGGAAAAGRFNKLVFQAVLCGDNSCFSGATTGREPSFASTTKPQSLHSKQESPPPTHQPGEPPPMANRRSSGNA